MDKLKKHIKCIDQLIKLWLKADNNDLKAAINRSVEEGLFSFENIRHQILHLKNSVHEESLLQWAEKSGMKHLPLKGRNILCLHAGNLPLVGFQDALASIMTGGNYFGKLSRKDPYLLPTFLKLVKESDLEGSVKWASDLNDFENLNADFLIFAGSKSSVEEVKNTLSDLRIIDSQTPTLIRTAHFSIAWIHDHSKQTMEDLTEAVFRYGGSGCRSAAIVIAPFRLKSEKCTFTDYVEAFWLNSPQKEKPPKSLYHRFAYNKSVGIDQAWLEDFLIEEYEKLPDEKFILYWIKGDETDLKRLIDNFGEGLQSVYSRDKIGTSIGGRTIEPLSMAQTPPIWWKPDQIDTINWLQNEVQH